MSVQRAYKPENLTPFLQKIVDEQRLEARDAQSGKGDNGRGPPPVPS